MKGIVFAKFFELVDDWTDRAMDANSPSESEDESRSLQTRRATDLKQQIHQFQLTD